MCVRCYCSVREFAKRRLEKQTLYTLIGIESAEIGGDRSGSVFIVLTTAPTTTLHTVTTLQQLHHQRPRPHHGLLDFMLQVAQSSQPKTWGHRVSKR